ncbi:hypothetical protein OS493_015694 [Desmophyllum pertusum]|uniref:Uncharacterized protein n=1 Tax=Desmophyllum pertusum TaxID=174260 RepID=A0A9W9YP81_9CNID|nr:hypothetical protein OS493_015694 [Desmophyllum pertusum]
MNFVEVSAGRDERRNLQEPIPELPSSPPRYEDVVPASSIAAPALPAYATSVVDNDEVLIALEDPDQFECPPSYEQAISGDKRYVIVFILFKLWKLILTATSSNTRGGSRNF